MHHSRHKVQSLLFVCAFALGLSVSAPAIAGGDQKFDTVSEATVIRSIQKLAQTHEQAQILEAIRFALKSRLFPALSTLAEHNPDFKVGTFPFALFLKNIERVQLAALNSQQPLQADANRSDDFYLLNGYIGVVNSSALQGSNRSLGLLLTHIALGAEGFDDDHYQISIALAIEDLKLRSKGHSPLAEIDVESLLTLAPSILQRKFPTAISPGASGKFVTASNGGFTGVGGGGDTTTIEMKLSLVEELALRFTYFRHGQCGGHWETATGYVRSVLNAPIESKLGIIKPAFGFVGHQMSIIIPRAPSREATISDDLVIDTMASLCALEGEK